MNFLAPWWVPVLAGGLTIPPLVLLYFLKLKRRRQAVPSTLLWRKAVQDLQVNSPFQRLRSNLLLFLQLLVLLLAILAVSEPIRSAKRGYEKAIVLMIDESASMQADEDGKKRLELAKDEALKAIADMSTAQRAMVIAFASRARVLTPFTDDKDALRSAVRSVEGTDEVGRLSEAMSLAEAHSTPTGEGVGTDSEIAMSQYLLFTDGRLPDSANVAVQRGVLDVVRIGHATANAGIVNLDVRRNYEKPEQVSVLARVRNFGGERQARDVSLYVDGDLKGVRAVDLAPLGDKAKLGKTTLAGMPAESSEATVPFEMTLATAAQVEVRLSGRDALPTDDRAYAVVAPPRPMTVLLVTPGNRFLRQLVGALPLERYETWTPDEYEKAADDKLIADGRCRFDVVILDGHSTKRLPPGNYIFFDGVPQIEGVKAGGKIEGQPFLDWDETHPILRHVAVEAMHVFSWKDVTLPREAVKLIEASNGPVIALLRRERNQYLICAFGLFDETRTYANTDWFFQEGFVVFGYNAVRYLSGNSTIGQQPPVTPGEAFTVGVKPASSTSVRRPDGRTDTVGVSTANLATYGQTDRVGIYSITGGLPGEDARAVNLVNEDESFIAPNEDFHIAAGEVKAGEGKSQVNRPLWPYLLGALGVVLLVEWFVYNKRVFI
jgi:hypothetical protein